MNSLVSADYGSSSDSNDENIITKTNTSNNNVKHFLTSASDSENDETNDEDSDNSNERSKTKEKKTTVPTVPVLPSASSILLNGNNNTGQVFNNPYKKAENDQIASLEKHVKMVETDAHTHMKNGKKICWNYRKGRCRFGSNCTYAHDSDLHMTESTTTTNQDSTQKTMVPKTATTGTLISKINNKKRPGLSDSIVPSKKVIKTYNAFKK